MPRPKTPKLPVNKTLISEVLQRVSNAKTKDEKIAILHEYKSQALTKVLLCNFAKSITFMFPEGKTPYTLNEDSGWSGTSTSHQRTQRTREIY